MKRLFWLILLMLAWLIAFLLAMPALIFAWQAEDWQVVGNPDQQWTVEDGLVTGLASQKGKTSWLVLREDIYSVPDNFVFQFEFTPLQGVDHNLIWNFLDDKNYYQAHFNGGAIWVSRFINGQEMLSVAKNFPTVLGQSYAVGIKQENNQVTIVIDNRPIIDFADWTHDEQSRGQVGFKLAPGSVIPVESQFSQINVNDPNVTILPVELIKQTDPVWGSLVYDTADQWSAQPTISRWGCALTSLTMIMRYYGLDTMPDGQAVTPAATNTWLLAQPDGYVGQGLVNWWAATRLIRQISDQYSTADRPLPKLEFAYQALDWPARLIAELISGRPAIVQVPGHFVVTHGFNQTSDVFFIRDPFYDFTQLGQYESVLSLRLFTPSQTDLSAIVVVHRPSIKVEIQNEFGENLAQTWSEQLSDYSLEEQTASWQFTMFNQPVDGEYKLLIEGAQTDSDLQILVYNQIAEVQDLTPLKNEQLNFADLKIPLKFTKLNGGELIDQFDWEAFLTGLANLYQTQLINQQTFVRLQTLAQLAQPVDRTTWPRYQTYLKNILELAKNPQNLEKINALQAIL